MEPSSKAPRHNTCASRDFSQVFTSLVLPAAVGAAAVLLKGARHRGPLLRVSADIGH